MGDSKELLKYIDTNIGSTPYREAADGRYSRDCECEVERQLGAGTKYQISSMRVVSAYVFEMYIVKKSRSLVQRHGGGMGLGGVGVESIDIWSNIDEDKQGKFDIGIEGSTIKETCHVCGGSKKCAFCGGIKRVICDRCEGKGGNCMKCFGTGEILCGACDGTGKCKECKASGKAEYSLWCIQEEECLGRDCIAIFEEDDNWIRLPCRDYYNTARWLYNADGKVIYSVDAALNAPLWYREHGSHGSLLLSIDTIKDVISGSKFRYCESSKVSEYEYGDLARGIRSRCPKDVFSGMAVRLKKEIDSLREFMKVEAGFHDELGKLRSARVFLRCVITKIPIGIDCSVLISGEKAFVAIPVENEIGLQSKFYTDSSKVEKRVRALKEKNNNKNAVCAFRFFDYYLVATLVVAAAVIAVPLFWGNIALEEYLSKVFNQTFVVGCAVFLSIEILVWFACWKWSWEVHGGCWEWLYGEWKDRFVRLLWVLVPLAVVLMLDAKVPHVSQVLQPVKEWFACISNIEWAYISGTCTLKLGIVAFARWRERPYRYVSGRGVVVEKGAVVLLAGLSLALLIWPTYLPDGLALKSISALVLSYVSIPVYCIGCAVFWPVWLLLLVVGYVCRMAGLLVWWIGSMLFWCISSFFS